MGSTGESAGADLPQRKRLRLLDYDYAQGGGYFISIDAVGRLPLFGRMDGACVVLNEVGAMVRRLWFEQPAHYPGIVLDAFVVMPEHVHGIVIQVDPRLTASQRANEQPGPVLGPAPTLAGGEAGIQDEKPITVPLLMRHYKSLTTKRYFEIRRRYPQSRLPEKLWQRSYYERVLRGERDFIEKREYIESNPQRRALKGP